MNIRSSVATALLLVTVALPLSATPAQASSGAWPSDRDSVSVTGYNFEIGIEADVVASDPNTALRVTYTAGRSFTDGTVRFLLPRYEWSGGLRPVAVFSGEFTFSDADRGGVSVLPAVNLLLPASPCTGRAGVVPLQDTTITSVPGFQLISVAHVSCAAGSHLVVRIKGLTAPKSAGPAVLPVVTTSSGQKPRVSVGVVEVHPTPRVVLQAYATGSFEIGVPFQVVVTATGPAGAVAGYRAILAMASEPDNCTLDPLPAQTVTFAAGALQQRQAISASLHTLTAQQLLVYDPTNRAVPALTPPFVVTGQPTDVVCPASFH